MIGQDVRCQCFFNWTLIGNVTNLHQNPMPSLKKISWWCQVESFPAFCGGFLPRQRASKSRNHYHNRTNGEYPKSEWQSVINDDDVEKQSAFCIQSHLTNRFRCVSPVSPSSERAHVCLASFLCTWALEALITIGRGLLGPWFRGREFSNQSKQWV